MFSLQTLKSKTALAIVFCLGYAPLAFATPVINEEENQLDLTHHPSPKELKEENSNNSFTLVPRSFSSLVTKERELPENLGVLSAAAISSYNKHDEKANIALGILERAGFHFVKEFEEELRMEVWEDMERDNIVFTYRGTIPTSPNAFADLAITKYAARDVCDKEPLTYLGTHFENQVRYWKSQNYIPESDTLDSVLTHLPTTSFVDNMKRVGGSILGGMGGYSLATIPFSLTPLGGSLIAFLSTYTIYQTLGGHHLERKAIDALVGVSKKALLWTNKVVEEYDSHPRIYYTGHSLGGFVANMVGELSDRKPKKVLVFNAPGGTQTFLKHHKKYLMGGHDNLLTWGKKALVVSEENFPHDWRNLTMNFTREHDIVGRVGGDNASRTSILIPDFHVPSPLSIGDYLLNNHGIFNLGSDLFPELYLKQE